MYLVFLYSFRPELPTDIEGIVMLVHFLLCIYCQARDIEWIQRIDFLWKQQVGLLDKDLLLVAYKLLICTEETGIKVT